MLWCLVLCGWTKATEILSIRVEKQSLGSDLVLMSLKLNKSNKKTIQTMYASFLSYFPERLYCGSCVSRATGVSFVSCITLSITLLHFMSNYIPLRFRWHMGKEEAVYVLQWIDFELQPHSWLIICYYTEKKHVICWYQISHNFIALIRKCS